MPALKWKPPAEIYDAVQRPAWWDAWIAYQAMLGEQYGRVYRESEVWRWYEKLWLQDPQILQEIGTRAALGVASQCEEVQRRGYASLTVWRLAVAEEARLAEKRRLKAEAEARAERARLQALWDAERWEEAKVGFRQAMIDGAPEKRKRLPPHAAWCAWLFANRWKIRQIEERMGVRGGITWLIARYIEAHLPEACLPPTTGSVDAFYVPDRRALLKRHFSEVGPPEGNPLGGAPPKADLAAEGRNRWIWLERERGQGLAEIAREIGLTKDRVRQIHIKQWRVETDRQKRERLAASIARERHRAWYAARRNLGRPLDLGGPRNTWLVYEPWTPEG